MRSIYKYVIPPNASGIKMPKGATVIHAGPQGADICLWARVNPSADEEIRSFVVVGTGGAVDDAAVHVGTVFQGPFVWHVFEVHDER
jgi:hypothetical protein